jgi:hypothetical protein
MIDEIRSPILRALVQQADPSGLSEVHWADGEIMRVRYDILIPSDESHDGVEEAVVDVIEVVRAGRRSVAQLREGHPGVIRADDLPVRVGPPGSG